MNTFGTTASKLSQDIAERERDLQLLLEFEENGGLHRIGISCDHQNPEIGAAIQRSFGKKNLNKMLMDAILKIAGAEVEAAKVKLRNHVQTGGGSL